jgi:hypothetical protein
MRPDFIRTLKWTYYLERSRPIRLPIGRLKTRWDEEVLWQQIITRVASFAFNPARQ